MTEPEPRSKSESRSPTLEKTGDGSHTLYSNRFNQHYHNPNGAVGESLHVFFHKNGLLDRLTLEDSTEPLSILEVGFGSGLNLLLLLDEYLKCGATFPVTYCSIEAYPIGESIARTLNYGNYLVNRDLADRLVEIFREARPGMNRFELLPGVELLLFVGMFDAFDPGKFRADFIFHDPFSPEANPDLWSGEVFGKLAGW
ncbi:MAG: MnmC family methyltransferase, partial [Balneolaceae bacterium]|nr:MnmC family methyltransferase [Balneolaceae bacterium]